MATEKNKKLFLDKFPSTAYNISKTARLIGVHRNTVLLWRNTDKEFNDRFEECLEGKIDDLEERLQLVAMGIPEIEGNKLVGWKERPNVRALEISLKALAKKRGYGDYIVVEKPTEEEHDQKTPNQLISEMLEIKKRYEGYDEGEEQ